MTEDNTTELFAIRINEDGKRWIGRFAKISYTMMVLVCFEAVVSIYFGLNSLFLNSGTYTGLYATLYSYSALLFGVISLVSNIYYLRFPRQLLRSIKVGDEYGANRAFRTLLRGAWIFMLYLILDVALILLSFTDRTVLSTIQ